GAVLGRLAARTEWFGQDHAHALLDRLLLAHGGRRAGGRCRRGGAAGRGTTGGGLPPRTGDALPGAPRAAVPALRGRHEAARRGLGAAGGRSGDPALRARGGGRTPGRGPVGGVPPARPPRARAAPRPPPPRPRPPPP